MQFKIFPALFDRPEKIRFQQQEDKEVVELFLRQHPIVNLGWITISIVASILPALFLNTASILGLTFINQISTVVLIEGLLIYYMLVLAYVFESFLSWYFNVYIVTNQHVVDVNFFSLLYRDIVEISLDDIEIISHATHGFLDALFNYGDVTIETSAENKQLVFENVPRPDFVTDRIQDLQNARKIFFEEGGAG